MRKRVNIGDCYRDCTAVWNTWTVERINMDLLGVPHAIVRNSADAKDRRTIACPTLLDRRRFDLVTEDLDRQAAVAAVAAVRVGRHAGGVTAPHQ